MILKALSALAEPTRLQAMQVLPNVQEICACNMMRGLDATQSRMLRRIRVLKKAGVTVDRRAARWVRYHQVRPDLPSPLKALLAVAQVEDGMA